MIDVNLHYTVVVKHPCIVGPTKFSKVVKKGQSLKLIGAKKAEILVVSEGPHRFFIYRVNELKLSMEL